MRRLPIVALFGFSSVLASCATGPDYKRPSVDMPGAWQDVAPFHAGVPGDSEIKGSWWEAFHDEQLNRLEQQAIEKNQSLLVAKAHLEQARAQVDVATSGLFPQIGLQAGAQREKISANRPLSNYSIPNQSTVQNNFQLGFAVNYEADLFGGVRRSVESARASADQAAADFENTRLILLSELAADYFSLREADTEIDVVRQGIALQEKALEFIKARHEHGLASGLDLAQQEALLDSNKTQLELLQTQRAQYEHAVATMVGVPAPEFSLPSMTGNLTPPVFPTGVPSDVLQRRPDISSAERAMAAANANIGVARSAYFPSVFLQPNVGWNSNEMSKLFNAPSLLWSLGASASQIVFDAGRTKASVKIAEESYRASVADYRQTILAAMQEVENGVTGMSLLGRASQQAKTSVQSSQRVLDIADDRYTGGLDTYLDVITAQQTLLSNQRQAVQIQGEQMLTSVYLVKALGGGWKGMDSAQLN